MSSRKKIVVLYSGGLDSFIMYNMARIEHPKADISAIYWDHGQPVAKREIEGLPSFVEVRKVDWLSTDNLPVVQPGRENMGPIMIPGRNLVFAVLIAAQELPDEIWIGALKGETHEKGTDKNYKFLEHLNNTVNYVLGPFMENRTITVKFPLADRGLNKLGEVEWALNNGIAPQDILSTRSCHNGETDRCGNCIQCLKRWAVFGVLGMEEQYDVYPPSSPFGRQFIDDVVESYNGVGNVYDKTSCEEVIPYIKIVFPDKFDE